MPKSFSPSEIEKSNVSGLINWLGDTPLVSPVKVMSAIMS